MRNLVKITLLFVFVLAYISSSAIIKPFDYINPDIYGSKTWVYAERADGSEIYPFYPYPDRPIVENVFHVGDNIAIGNSFDIKMFEESDFGENGRFDYTFVIINKADFSTFKYGRVGATWEYISTRQEGSTIWMVSEDAENIGFDSFLQAGEFITLFMIEGISFGKAEFTILPGPGQQFNPDGAKKVNTSSTKISKGSEGSDNGVIIGKAEKAIIERKE